MNIHYLPRGNKKAHNQSGQPVPCEDSHQILPTYKSDMLYHYDYPFTESLCTFFVPCYIIWN